MTSGNPAANTPTNVSTTHQPGTQTVSRNQVRVDDAHLQQQQQQQPPPPHRSSSLLPTLRRRASEPQPHNHRHHYTHKPGDTHTRYTYRFNQRERCSGYTFGLAQRDTEYSDDEGGYVQNDGYRPGVRHDLGAVSHSQTLSSINRHTEGNLNRERSEYGYTQVCTRSQTPVDRIPLDNTQYYTYTDAQGNADRHKSRHTRSRTLDDINSQDSHQSSSYVENIRAMAGQMYGEPHTHSRIPTPAQNRNTHTPADMYVDAHSHNYAYNRALTRHHHLSFSGGL